MNISSFVYKLPSSGNVGTDESSWGDNTYYCLLKSLFDWLMQYHNSHVWMWIIERTTKNWLRENYIIFLCAFLHCSPGYLSFERLAPMFQMYLQVDWQIRGWCASLPLLNQRVRHPTFGRPLSAWRPTNINHIFTLVYPLIYITRICIVAI